MLEHMLVEKLLVKVMDNHKKVASYKLLCMPLSSLSNF